MIARTWHGAVPADKADAYHEYLLRTGVAGYQATEGNRGVYVLRRTEGETVHFLLITLWESLDAIQAFAGEDAERARYYPEDAAYLLEMEPHVRHYDVAHFSGLTSLEPGKGTDVDP
jgi:heme-degrading monooxygenase HmoA